MNYLKTIKLTIAKKKESNWPFILGLITAILFISSIVLGKLYYLSLIHRISIASTFFVAIVMGIRKRFITDWKPIGSIIFKETEIKVKIKNIEFTIDKIHVKNIIFIFDSVMGDHVSKQKPYSSGADNKILISTTLNHYEYYVHIPDRIKLKVIKRFFKEKWTDVYENL